MFATVKQLGNSKKQVDVIFDRDWMGFKKGYETTVFEYVAEKLIKQGLAHLRIGSKVEEIKVKKLIKKETEMKESVQESVKESQEQKEFKRPPRDKMVKKATVSK